MIQMRRQKNFKSKKVKIAKTGYSLNLI